MGYYISIGLCPLSVCICDVPAEWVLYPFQHQRLASTLSQTLSGNGLLGNSKSPYLVVDDDVVFGRHVISNVVIDDKTEESVK